MGTSNGDSVYLGELEKVSLRKYEGSRKLKGKGKDRAFQKENSCRKSQVGGNTHEVRLGVPGASGW